MNTNNIKNWWINNHLQIKQDLERSIRRLDHWFDRLVANTVRLMIIGVIINLVTSFYPDFKNRFPAIYGWFDGWLQFGEFVSRAALSGIYSFFTGNWTEFWTEYNEAFQELLHQFTNWIGNIHF